MKWWVGRQVQLRAVGVLAAGGVALLAAMSVMLDWPDWAGLGRWARPHVVLLVLFVATGVCIVVGLWLLRGGRASSAGMPVTSWWIVVGAAVIVTVVAWGATSWLLDEAGTANDVGAARVDAIKTGLGIGAGTTGIFALPLVVRRQRHLEADAAEKNVTELYTKAADHLGSDKAPVRLAGLYALERLAQGNSLQRQSIVNIVCAYLRMPFTPPEAQRPEGATEEAHAALRSEQRDYTQEREVRLAAQRVLVEHLQPHRAEAFWNDIDLDLTGARLSNFHLIDSRVRTAEFDGAIFNNGAGFARATFDRGASFDHATFDNTSSFQAVTFGAYVRFVEATFARRVRFDGVVFNGPARFVGVTFNGAARFGNATFNGITQFDEATFAEEAQFDGATFNGAVTFVNATQKGGTFVQPDSVVTRE